MSWFKKKEKKIKCNHLWFGDRVVELKGTFYCVRWDRVLGKGNKLSIPHSKCMKCGIRKSDSPWKLFKDKTLIQSQPFNDVYKILDEDFNVIVDSED